jgi:hypothetical protein
MLRLRLQVVNLSGSMKRETAHESTPVPGWSRHGQRFLLTLIILMVPLAYPLVASSSAQGHLLNQAVFEQGNAPVAESAPDFRVDPVAMNNVQPAAFQLLTRHAQAISVDGECWLWDEHGSPSQAAFDARDSSTTTTAPISTVVQPFTETSPVALSLPISSSFLVAASGTRELTGIAHLPEGPPPRSHQTI